MRPPKTGVLVAPEPSFCSVQIEDEQKKDVQRLEKRVQQADFELGTMGQSLQEAEEANGALMKV